MGALKPQKARFVYFFRKLSSLTTLEAASSGLASGLAAAASGLASRLGGSAERGALFRRRQRGGRLVGAGLDLFAGAGLVLAVELQAEAHRGIDEGRQRGERHLYAFLLLVEAHRHFEELVVDDEVPVLVLEHDRHLFRILGAQIVGQLHAGVGAAEGNVEMVRAGQALVGDLSQHAAHDAAQRIVDESVVVKAIVHVVPELSRSIGLRIRRVNRVKARKTLGRKWEGFCCPVPSRTALTSAV